MNITGPAGKPASVEVSYSDPGLFIGLQLYDDSGLTPTPVGAVIPMLNWAGVAYRAKVSAPSNTYFLYRIAAFTDVTYTVEDANQPQGSGSIYLQSPDLSGMELDLAVENNGDLMATVDNGPDSVVEVETFSAIEVFAQVS